ncbi:siphovirus ReqiPepy6 Gp37-like family protein [Salibacterium aidingense]|uniref:siphovirus ReqiPepy6 Gp37-like family protein n=1 Tax=Salibacterium aidingense TaxID=384933 RepID=UPI003BD33671
MFYLLDGSTRAPVAIFEDYQKLEWKRPLYTPGTFKMAINANQFNARYIQKGTVFIPDNDEPVFMVEQLEGREDKKGKEDEVLSVTGRSIGGMFEERIALPPDGDSHDRVNNVPAEQAIKHYVRQNAESNAAAVRRVPGLVIQTGQGRGEAVTYNARFQTVAEVLEDIGNTTGSGWEILLNEENEFALDTIHGVDRSEDVFFDVEFDTALSQSWLTSDMDQKTFAYVAGQGEGVERQMIEYYLADDEPAGFNRRELFVDARDTDSDLDQRGRTKLKETEEEDIFETEVDPFGSFQYRRDWDLGDIVTMRNRRWGIQKAVRIVAVKTVIQDDKETITVEVGRPWPTIKNRIENLTEDEAGKRV